MMHESKEYIEAKAHPYIIFTLHFDKFTGRSWLVSLFSGQFLTSETRPGIEVSMISSSTLCR